VVAVAPDAPDGLGRLALAGIQCRVPSAVAPGVSPPDRTGLLELPAAPLPRLLAAAGVALLPSLAAAVAHAVGDR
jgi:hypothetical protein